jgi:multicomponent Na+:H+ antiporter subunit G
MNLDFDLDGLSGLGVRDVVTAVLVLLSALMCFAAGVGLIRFPDVLSRLHAATKPQILGLIAIVADVAVTNFSVGTVTLAVAIVFFQGLTAPASAHMAGRAAYRAGHFDRGNLIVDEFAKVERPADGPDLESPDAAASDTAADADDSDASAGDDGDGTKAASPDMPDANAELGEHDDSPADNLEQRHER